MNKYIIIFSFLFLTIPAYSFNKDADCKTSKKTQTKKFIIITQTYCKLDGGRWVKALQYDHRA